MPRRQAPPPKDFAFDFTADWSPYADIPSGSPAAEGWTLCGTVTKRGETHGLAIKGGLFAACNRNGLIFPLTAIETSRVSLAVRFKDQPGWDRVPKGADTWCGHAMPPDMRR